MNYKYSSYCDTPEESIPDYCVKMGIRSNRLTCVNCEPGYYLKDNECVRQCNFDNYVISMQNLEIISGKIVNHGESKCVHSVGDLCLVKTYAVTFGTKTLNEICAKCKDNSLPVITLANSKHAHVLDIESTISANNHPMIRSPSLDCVESETLFAAVHAGTVKEHCKYFLKNGTEYVCQRCVNGFTGPLMHVVDLSSGITDCSIAVQYCENEFNFKGANYKAENSPILEGLFSCSSCEGDRIPFIHVRRESLGEFYLRSYDINKADQPFHEGVDPMGNAVVCRNPNDPSDFGLTSPITSFTRSCGLGMINVLSSKTSDEFLKCLACLPGFKATYDPTNKDYVTNCEKVENCDTSYGFQWFNACSRCTGGFIFEFDDTSNTIQYDKCCLLYTSPSPRDLSTSRMPSSA